MKKLFISAGHGGKDPGAVANNRTEHEVVAAVAKESVKRLRDLGVDAVLVPIGLTLANRIAWVKRETQAGDFLVELHMNAAGSQEASGAEGYYLTESTYAQSVCSKFVQTYVQNIRIKYRKVAGDTTTRHGRLGIVRDTPPLALLIELGFLTNKKDLTEVEARGVDAFVSACMDMMGVDIPKQGISPWAQNAVDKCIKKNIAVFWHDPQELVGGVILEHMLHNAGIIETVTGNGMTKERMAVVLDRIRLVASGEKSLLD